MGSLLQWWLDKYGERVIKYTGITFFKREVTPTLDNIENQLLTSLDRMDIGNVGRALLVSMGVNLVDDIIQYASTLNGIGFLSPIGKEQVELTHQLCKELVGKATPKPVEESEGGAI